MERRYRETESTMVRDELANYLSTQPCPDCEGTRLNLAARHVFVADRALPQITGLPVGKARRSSPGWSCPAPRARSLPRSSRRSTIAWASWSTSAWNT